MTSFPPAPEPRLVPPPERRDWHPLGPNHRYFVDGDTIHWETHGALAIADVVGLQQVMTDVKRQMGTLLLVCDTRLGASVGPEVRRYISRWEDVGAPSCPTAVIGANLLIRTLVTLIMNAGRLLTGRTPPFLFFATEAEGYAWLAQQRTRLLREQAREKPSPR